MGFTSVYEECSHCETMYPTVEGQYFSNGKFLCGNCISELSLSLAPVSKMKARQPGDDRDYSSVVEFVSAPA